MFMKCISEHEDTSMINSIEVVISRMVDLVSPVLNMKDAYKLHLTTVLSLKTDLSTYGQVDMTGMTYMQQHYRPGIKRIVKQTNI